jgi:putative peptidoglycan lipid II flippase
MVNTNFAAGITDAAGHVINGPVSWLGYAFRFMQLPLGVFGVAIASATLPSISRKVAESERGEFRGLLARSLGMVFLLTVPSSVGLAVLGEPMIGAVYQGGEFSAADTHQTALALTSYAVGLAGYSATKVLAPAFYALSDSRTPMLVSLASIAVNYVASATLVRLAGHAGLALSTSVVALFGFAALLLAMRNRIGGVHGQVLASSIAKTLAASTAMGMVCALSSWAVRAGLGVSRTARLADLAISIPLGIAVFYVLARALRIREMEAARTALAGPFARRLAMLRDTLD